MFQWITETVQQGGYLGIAALMLAENLFPPIPSELIMPLAGFLAAQGELNAALVILSGTAGSVLGAMVWYLVGLRLGLERLRRLAARHGRWMGTGPGDIDRAHAGFSRHCGKAVLGGRLVPAVSTVISIPAGIARMKLRRFVMFTAIGSVLWTGFLTGFGFVLEDQYRRVADWVDPVSYLIVGSLAALYLYRVITFKPQMAGEQSR